MYCQMLLEGLIAVRKGGQESMRKLLRATQAKRHFSSSICLGLSLWLPCVLASCSPPGNRGGLAKHPTSAACGTNKATCPNFNPATPTPSPAPLMGHTHEAKH
jgi:hypothetical protein